MLMLIGGLDLTPRGQHARGDAMRARDLILIATKVPKIGLLKLPNLPKCLNELVFEQFR